MNTYTPAQIKHKVFHIHTATVKGGNVELQALIDWNNNEGPELCTIRFPVPDAYKGHEDEVPQFGGRHMVGFEHGLLADARTVWGFVCPCQQ